MKDVPDHLRRQGGGIPDLVSCRWWENDQIADSLVVGIDWKIGFEHFVSAQVVPVEMRGDSSGRDKGIIFLLRVEVGTNAHDRSI